ncbi:MAG: response regulator, partial [Pseudomonadota bacterium]
MDQNKEMNNQRILVVDDQNSIHEDFNKILLPNNNNDETLQNLENALFDDNPDNSSETQLFDLEHAYNGEEAINKIQESIEKSLPYAMAFVDVRMPPGIDGIETISEIWKIDPNIQIVICTAFSDYSWQETIKKINNSDQFLILKKPFDMIEVLQLACSLTSKWNLAQLAKKNLQQLGAMVEIRTKQLFEKTQTLQKTIDELTATKIQLFQADKLASIGQLAAGLAHEINNPIGFVSSNLNFLQENIKDFYTLLELQKPLLEETPSQEETNKFKTELLVFLKEKDMDIVIEDMQEILTDSKEGVDRIAKIVGDLMDFS